MSSNTGEDKANKADLTAHTVALRQLRMEEKMLRKVMDECAGQLTQLQVEALELKARMRSTDIKKTTDDDLKPFDVK